ncbi:response regulator transcription factor [Tissierella pigra]|uniref:Response regulator transcription factor n=1 Tax=Tissierella pigra TaxID=2607614 RepID=A0A6N7Y055_9FIRM|nr:response regulator transcription factor [Tissierella pigra]MBU5427039.1 response regulator transcription factor [Tissierella pigra]MSU03123.1 response regulator transcription factor [Tissierella pigra]
MKNILLIEDDENISFGIKRYLDKRDFNVEIGSDIATGKEKFKADYDLIVLDMNLPDGSGYDFLEFIKSKSHIPVIFLTVKNEDEEIVKGLGLGADDYITKPFKLSVLEARINTVLRRVKRDISLDDVIFSNDIKLIKSQTKVLKEDKEIFLTSREYRLLEMFMENKDQTLTRRFILERLWDIDGDFINDNTLTVAIKRLREKIEYNPNNPKILKTIRGIGYRMENNNGKIK